MDYHMLGRGGVRVSAIGLGGNTFGRGVDEGQTAAVVARALDLGINHFDFDRADTYGGGGVSERFLGAALKGRHHDAIVVTKTGFPLGAGLNADGLSRRCVMSCCAASLTRLGAGYVLTCSTYSASDSASDPRTPTSRNRSTRLLARVAARWANWPWHGCSRSRRSAP